VKRAEGGRRPGVSASKEEAPVSENEPSRDEQAHPPAKKSDRTTMIIVVGFGVALLLLIVLNMN
jgi:hypothetical protein